MEAPHAMARSVDSIAILVTQRAQMERLVSWIIPVWMPMGVVPWTRIAHPMALGQAPIHASANPVIRATVILALRLLVLLHYPHPPTDPWTG